MQVKVVSGDGREESCYSCTDYHKTEDDSSISVRLIPGNQLISIPRDGAAIFVENNEGHTIHSWRLDERRAQLRVLG